MATTRVKSWYLAFCIPAVAALIGVACAQTPHPTREKIVARGNEPSWTLTIDDAGLRLAASGHPDFFASTVVQDRTPAGASRTTAIEGKRTVRATVHPGLCADTMTGMPYPAAVSVEIDGLALAGCAGTPAEALQGDWRVLEIGGSVPAVDSKPALTFDGSQVSGTGGCNRVGGEVKITNEGLTFGPMWSTMMACEDPLMKQERALLDLLDKVHGVTVLTADRIRLEAQNGQGVMLERGKYP